MRYVVFEFPALTGGNACNRSACTERAAVNVSKFRPTSGCASATQFCFANTHAARPSTWPFNFQLSTFKLLVGSKFYVNRDPGESGRDAQRKRIHIQIFKFSNCMHANNECRQNKIHHTSYIIHWHIIIMIIYLTNNNNNVI